MDSSEIEAAIVYKYSFSFTQNSSEMESRLKVLMFPWLAHGHTTPMLELAKKLSHTHLFDIYICSTPANLNSFKNKETHNWAHTIHLHLPADELPPHSHTTSCIPTHLHPTLKRALKKAKPDFSNLLKTLQPHLLISDITLPWARSTASLHNIPVVTFSVFPGVAMSHIFHLIMHPGTEFPFPAIRLTNYEMSILEKQSAADDYDDDPGTIGMLMVNSSRVIDGKYMDYACELIKGLKIIPTGALVQDPVVIQGDDDELIQWLGQKGPCSSVLVAFGSEYFLKREEIEEIAYGLEMSDVNFIWVLRAPKGEEINIDECLPLGFLQRVGERGRVVQRMVPQVKILKHSSIGGFVSHCGWSSVLESIDFGVPIIGMPMHLDQPMNARVAVELGVGVEVERDREGRLRRDKLSQVIKDVVGGTTSEAMRKRVKEARDNIRSSRKEEMDGLVHMLTQLCGKREEDLISGIA